MAVRQHQRELGGYATPGRCSGMVNQIATGKFSALTLPFAMFHDIFQQPSATSVIYKGMPLVRMVPKARGEALATLARKVLSDLNPSLRSEPASTGRCINGTRRGFNTTEYDWISNGRRVEHKSSLMSWNHSGPRWYFYFKNVKFAFGFAPAAFDDLILSLVCPDRIYMYRHDHSLGVTLHGRVTPCCGHGIRLDGPRNATWEHSVSHVLDKLDASDNACERILDLAVDDYRVLDAVAGHDSHMVDAAYKLSPLAGTIPSVRGLRIQKLALRVDRLLYPAAIISDYARSAYSGHDSQHESHHDWIRNGLRIECKHSQLKWERRGQRWHLRFSGVKQGAYDELHLAVYAPSGIYIYRHDHDFGWAATGKTTPVLGKHINVYGPKGVVDWERALAVILTKLNLSTCKLLAIVSWEL